MKFPKFFLISLLATSLSADTAKETTKLNFDQRVEIVRGLMAEQRQRAKADAAAPALNCFAYGSQGRLGL